MSQPSIYPVPRIEVLGKFPRNVYAVSWWRETEAGFLSIDLEFKHTKWGARRVIRAWLVEASAHYSVPDGSIVRSEYEYGR